MIIRRDKVAALPAPQPNPDGPSGSPADPGVSLKHRPLTYLSLLIPVLMVILLTDWWR